MKMIKVHVDVDEWYPVYTLSDNSKYSSATIEVSEEFYLAAKITTGDFNMLLQKIEEMIEKQGGTV